MISFSASSHAEKLRSPSMTLGSNPGISANAAVDADNASVGSPKCPASFLKLTHPSPCTRDKATQRARSVSATFGKTYSPSNDGVTSITSIYNRTSQTRPWGFLKIAAQAANNKAKSARTLVPVSSDAKSKRSSRIVCSLTSAVHALCTPAQTKTLAHEKNKLQARWKKLLHPVCMTTIKSTLDLDF